MCEFIIVRHGETFWNVEGRQQGHLDSPLTRLGIAQAEALARRIGELPFTTLYSSDLGRAWETARIIARTSKHTVQAEPRLREIHLGVLQGLTREEMQARLPDEYVAYKKGGPDYTIREGQSLRSFSDSNIQLAEELAGKHRDERIVLVTHGGFLSTFFRYVTGLPLDAPRSFLLPNGSLNVFVKEDKVWRLKTWGDVSHLDGLGSRDDQ